MSIFTEHPFVIGIVGVALIGLVFYFWSETRFVWLAYLGLALIGVVAGLIAFERYYVTDKEALQTTIIGIAQAVQKNDVNRTVSFFSDKAEPTRARVQKEMPTYKFRSCRIFNWRNMEIKDSTAAVEFMVAVDLDAPTYNYNGHAIRTVTLLFEKQNDLWKVVDYRHYEPNQGGAIGLEPFELRK